MKINRILITIFFLTIILTKCAYLPRPHPASERSPVIRIGIAEKLETLSFESDATLNIFDQNDRLIGSQIKGVNWKVTLVDSKPVTLLYRLFYQQVNQEAVAQRIVGDLNENGMPATFNQLKAKHVASRMTNAEAGYQIFLKPVFQSESDAKNYSNALGGKISTTPLAFFDSRPTGKIILENVDTGQKFDSEGLLRIQGHGFRFNVQVGEGYHFEKQELRIYKESLEFWIDRYGKLTVVNQIPIEEYLKGVAGSEMSPEFPLEALKAQAVTARSYTLSRMDKQHRLEPFDVCDEVHCHVYGGVDREKPAVVQAVSETNGQVLMFGDQICETFYAGVCGGHGENNENVWTGDPRPYLRGKLDSPLATSFPGNYLKDESQVRRWIETSPDVYCNTTLAEVPDALNYTKRYFRWTEKYSQSEISTIILNKTGERIGTLVEIIPVERGVSGRLKKIKLRGTQKTATIEGELAIRKALSSNYLFSSCFIVDQQNNDFIIKGAGWGHGVGMCQTGAAMMALKGQNYRAILNHYYQNSAIVKLY